jgi:hypothetical protein
VYRKKYLGPTETNDITTWICIGWLGIFAFKNILMELTLLLQYSRFGWMNSYLTGYRLLAYVNSILVVMVLVTELSLEEHTMETITLALAFSGRVVKVLSFMRVVEAGRFGLRILPVISSLKESVTFLLLVFSMIFVLWSLFWSLEDATGRTGFSVFDSLYRLGLLGDFDSEEDVLTAEDGGLQAWQYFGFMAASLLVSVALMNIFIGMFSTYFDHYTDRVVELFVQTRAEVSLKYMLQVHGMGCKFGLLRPDSYVWFCSKDAADDSESAVADESLSLRSTLKSTFNDELAPVLVQVAEMQDQMKQMQKDLERLVTRDGS